MVIPERSETDRRMYSLNDVDRLWEVKKKDYLADGLTIMAIQKIFNKNTREIRIEGKRKKEGADGWRCPTDLLRRIMHISRYSGGEKWNL